MGLLDDLNKTRESGNNHRATEKLAGLLMEKRDIVPFPTEAFPPRLQAMMHGYHDVFGSSYEHYGLSLLTAAATAIGSALQIKLKSCHRPVLFSVLVAPPGSGKTPIIRTAIDRLQHIASREVEEFKIKYKEYREEQKRNKDEEEESDRPQPKRPVVTSFTIERLYKLLLTTPNGLLVYRDELRGWLTGMNQYKNGGDEYEFWLSAHDSMPFAVDRKSDPIPMLIDHVMVNIIGGTQPGVLKSIVTQGNLASGLISRLTFAWPDSQVLRDYNEDEVNPDYANRWGRIIDVLYRLEPETFVFEDVTKDIPHTIHLSSAAKDHFAKYWNSLQQRQRDNDDDAELATISKFRSRSLRLALILHAIEWACEVVENNLDTAGGDANDVFADGYQLINRIYEPVTGETMLRAIELALHYENANMRVIRQTTNPVDALPDHERAWYLSLPEEGKRAEAIALGITAGMKEKTIYRRLKQRKELFKYDKGTFKKLW